MALGSAPGAVMRMFVSEGLRITALGLVLGVAASVWLTRLLQTYLFGVTRTDVTTYAIVIYRAGVGPHD